MILDFNDSEFSLKEVSLKANQKSQLLDWGFKSDDSSNLFYTGRIAEKVLIKVINYFAKEKVQFNATKTCETKIALITERTDQFEGIKEIGENFKKSSVKVYKKLFPFFGKVDIINQDANIIKTFSSELIINRALKLIQLIDILRYEVKIVSYVLLFNFIGLV